MQIGACVRSRKPKFFTLSHARHNAQLLALVLQQWAEQRGGCVRALTDRARDLIERVKSNGGCVALHVNAHQIILPWPNPAQMGFGFTHVFVTKATKFLT